MSNPPREKIMEKFDAASAEDAERKSGVRVLIPLMNIDNFEMLVGHHASQYACGNFFHKGRIAAVGFLATLCA